MKNTVEKNGIYKIVSYPKEVYCIHYKDKPFSLSYVSREEQRALGISYPSIGTISRKCYFTEGNAKSGIKHLPERLRDKVEIVKYVPIQQEKTTKILEILKQHCDNCPCNYDCKKHNLDDMSCVIEDIRNLINNFNIK